MHTARCQTVLTAGKIIITLVRPVGLDSSTAATAETKGQLT